MPLYFFEGRNTGVHASSAAEARKKKKRGGDKIVKVLNKEPKPGVWDRTRKDGKSPEKSAYGKGRGFGPPRSKKK